MRSSFQTKQRCVSVLALSDPAMDLSSSDIVTSPRAHARSYAAAPAAVSTRRLHLYSGTFETMSVAASSLAIFLVCPSPMPVKC